ncbi:flagellar hook-basal body protein [Massilia antarctica]|uniref:flagellar hook-basal body protein n=1 Tax=Massilia antarctica TaxID=2765360 RepID=UPI0006BD099A|nr:flagellar hook basal-body protein [Massilia sp. H27-R4]MCY0915667.1 flagellar hook basal-body protein [Massilia sp. H27-R4]CUI02859.1 Flagellar basal-body rod protein FlgF [Janthinobacterium sp. CG23_2]CUU26645.1 Flagellar basal-body rod protein FlgF [Janthinobacterium sp. CG23_2]
MDALTIAGIAMQNDMQRMDSISQNLANVMTPGYKRSIPVSRAFADLMGGAASGAAALHESTAAQMLDTSAGTLRATSNPMDIAIEGNGYFEVATEQGTAYSRQGTLQVDPRGRLCNGDGRALIGLGGEIVIAPGPFSVEADGKVKQNGQTVGQLKVVQFSNPQGLLPMGNGLLAQGDATVSDHNVAARVRTGFLENSNVSSPQEMIRLTETLRHFETMIKVAQGYEDVFQKTVSKLGEF